MASANWLKATTQKAGALKKHLGQKERELGNHANPNIDKTLSKTNYALGCTDYGEALERMKRRTKEVDKLIPPKRVRKDRVTCCFIELPCPLTLTERGISDEFFKSSYKTLSDFFGAENVHGGFVHKDEVHTYTDKDKTLRKSLEHIHVLVSAYTPEKGINGKAFETRARLKALNRALDDMCFRSYGVHLNTKETPEHKSVERLKEETALRATADSLRAIAQQHGKEIQEQEQKLLELRTARSEEVFEKVGAIKAISEKLSSGTKKLTKQEQETVANVAANVGQIEAEYARLKEDVQKQKQELETLKKQEYALIDRKGQKLAEDMVNYYEKQAEKAKIDAQKQEDEAIRKLMYIDKEKEKAVNEAVKPYKQKLNQDKAEIEYVRAVCEYATNEPFEQAERRYRKWLDELDKKERRSRGRER